MIFFGVILFCSLLNSDSAYQPEPKIKVLSYNTNYTFTINKTIEYILEFTDDKVYGYSDAPPRIWIQSGASAAAPLMIVARQTKEMLSWQLPLEVESESGETLFNYTSRTLCHDIIHHYKVFGQSKINHENPIVSVATASDETVEFIINVHYQEKFYIDHSEEYNFTVSPSEPKYFFYNFSTNVSQLMIAESNYETVILEVSSDDDICMTVSIQNISCPVFDTNQDVTFRGFYETVNKKGGITIPKYKFPYGFYVVFVVKPDDYQCTRTIGLLDMNSTRKKHISFIIKPSITYGDYLKAVIITLSCIGAFYVIFGLSYFLCSVRGNLPRQMSYVPNNLPETPRARVVRMKSTNRGNTGTGTNDILDNTSIDVSDYDTLEEIDSDADMRLGRGHPCLLDLARKHPRVLKKKSYLYLYNVMTVALFYALPVVQLVITYQRVLNETGQQDLCYYNFLCAHPLGLISDFNHLFSNIGYILLGILFLVITYIKELTHNDEDFDRQFGIPQHYGLFYAMGVALVMEGILSGSYHVCPSQLNFQFDTSFMYVMAVLCMVKLYQNRHPDINANAYATFGVLAIAVLLGMIGILEATTVFWAFFVILYLVMCVYLSIKIYYMGCWKFRDISLQRLKQVWIHDFWSGPLNVLKPCHKARFVLLLLGNICNWALAVFGLYQHPKNFAVFLLAIFMANTLLYFFFYIVMKYINGERVRIMTWIFLFFSSVCAVSAMYFFLHKSISWSKTAAESRQFNMECKLLMFYDFHDIWHFLSAIGMFFTFMVLLTMDDDISHTHHSQIPVF
ncbi:sid-1-related C isoform X2 [Leptinotarsa decemlineata]|uniref:sid-1-related C isoform X2 n=1 Tax=Leptinotarsa decemlineata TaxID=7539 RepID=UPI003D3057B9